MTKARVLDSRPVYPGRVVDLHVERIELPNGSVNDNPHYTYRRYYYDGLGRLRREQVSHPAGDCGTT